MGYEDEIKRQWLGDAYAGPLRTDVAKTNVPKVRQEFCRRMWESEMAIVYGTPGYDQE